MSVRRYETEDDELDARWEAHQDRLAEEADELDRLNPVEDET